MTRHGHTTNLLRTSGRTRHDAAMSFPSARPGLRRPRVGPVGLAVVAPLVAALVLVRFLVMGAIFGGLIIGVVLYGLGWTCWAVPTRAAKTVIAGSRRSGPFGNAAPMRDRAAGWVQIVAGRVAGLDRRLRVLR